MSHRQDVPGGPVGPISEPTNDALRSFLGPGERVRRTLTAVGCSLVLTDRQLLLVREGSSYRPRSGVHAWPLDRRLTVRTTPVHHGTGRIVIEGDHPTTSVFVSAEGWAAADTLLREMHRLIHVSGHRALPPD